MNTGIHSRHSLTERQQKALNIIVSAIETDGFPPTVREIRDEMGVSSIRGASVHLEALERKGYIQTTGKARGIKVLRRYDIEGENDAAEIRIPLIGQVQAGGPVWAEENFERFINIKRSYLKGYQEAFALNVKGDSMLEAGIEPGDIALIHPTETATNGEIVVALLEDEVTIKTYHQVDNFIALLPANPSYEPIIGRAFNIQGKLIGLVKQNEDYNDSLSNEATLVPISTKEAKEEHTPVVKWSYGTGARS